MNEIQNANNLKVIVSEIWSSLDLQYITPFTNESMLFYVQKVILQNTNI